MNVTNRTLFKSIALVLLAVLLLSCGGKEERKAKYLERGKTYLAEKNYDKARIEFKNVLQIDPKDAQGYLYLGQVEERKQNWAQAFGAYAKASELDPELIEPRIRLAKFYLAQASALEARGEKDRQANALGLVQEQIKDIRAREPENDKALTLEATLWVNDGDNAKAVAQLEKVLARNPGLQSAAVLLSSIYDQEGRFGDAEALLLKAVKANPEPVVWQQRLAEHYAKNKQNEKAEGLMRQIVEENPDELSYRVGLASFLSRTEQLDKAEQVLNDAITADPEDTQRYLLLTEFLASRMSKDAAIEKLQEFIAQKPEMTDLQMSLVKLYLSSEQKDKARETLESIIEKQGLAPAGLKARVALAQLLAGESMDDERITVLLKQVLDENPRDNGALLLKGRLAAYHKDYVGAINDFRSVLKDQPDDAEVLQVLAAAHLANNERALAVDTLRRGVESNPGKPRLRLALAQLLVQDGDLDSANEQLDEALKVDKNNQLVLKAKFELLARKGDAAGMEEVARLMQERAPDSEVGFIQEARLRFAQKDYDAAIQILDKLLEKNPKNVPALLAKSDVLAAQKKYAEATAVVDELQKAQPGNGEGYLRKGLLLAEQDDVAGAIKQYEVALQKAPRSVEALTALVGLEVKQGNADAAEQRLKAILEKDPEHRSANDLLGMVYLAEKDPVKAEAAFERQIEINPKSSTVYSQLAQARMVGGNPAGAAQAYEDGLRQLPDDTSLMIGLAGVRERQQDYDKAIALYEEVLAKQPDNALSINNLAALLTDQRTDEASLAKAAELSTKLEKTNQPAFLDTAAWVYYRKGDYDKAAEILKGVVEKAPKVPVVQYHLGMVYYKQGTRPAAREHLTKATDGDYDYQGVEEARAMLKSL